MSTRTRRKPSGWSRRRGARRCWCRATSRTPRTAARSSSKAVTELGGIDILVNNAAHQASFKDIDDISDEEWELTFRVNIHAMFYLTKAAVPHMKPGSAIINTASINSDHAQPDAARLRDHQGRDPELHGGAGAAARREGHPRQCRRARPDLDAAHPLDHAGGCGRRISASRCR